MPGINTALEKQRREQRMKIYKALSERPADESRKAALEQIARFEAALQGSKDSLGTALGRWKSFDWSLSEAKAQVAEGDKLQAATDEASRVQRRRYYSRAYVNLLGTTDQLDEETAAGSTWSTILQQYTDTAENVVKKGIEKAESVVEKVADKVGDIGEKLDDTTTFLTIAAGVALVAFAYGRGKR